jgi:hypothetical protein
MAKIFADLIKEMESSNKTCTNVNTIKKINDQYDYKDEHPYGEGDSLEVSCGQANGYNELQYIYDEKLYLSIILGDITEDKAIKALCEACKNLPNPRNRQDFYDFLSKKLGIDIE